MKKPIYIFVHMTGISFKKNPDQAIATNGYHKRKWKQKPSSLGFYGAYNVEVSYEGKKTVFREDGEVNKYAQYIQKTSSVFPVKIKGYLNSGAALSICLDGNFNIEDPSIAQCRTAYDWIIEKMEQHDIPRENVFPHRFVQNKTCWGSRLPNDVMDYFEKRLGIGDVPEWAKETVKMAKLKDITEWDDPWEEITPEMVEWILHDLGLRDELRGTISKVEFVHALRKGGLLD